VVQPRSVALEPLHSLARGFAAGLLQPTRSASTVSPRRPLKPPNRRMRTRMYGGVTGTACEGLPMSIEKMRENQKALPYKDFQKQFLLGPLCKSDLVFSNHFNTEARRHGDGPFLVSGSWLQESGIGSRDSGFGIRDSGLGRPLPCRQLKTQNSQLETAVQRRSYSLQPSVPQDSRPKTQDPRLPFLKPPSLLSSGIGIRDSGFRTRPPFAVPSTQNSKLATRNCRSAPFLQPTAFRSSSLQACCPLVSGFRTRPPFAVPSTQNSKLATRNCRSARRSRPHLRFTSARLARTS
jgi:hypothetical protein